MATGDVWQSPWKSLLTHPSWISSLSINKCLGPRLPYFLLSCLEVLFTEVGKAYSSYIHSADAY